MCMCASARATHALPCLLLRLGGELVVDAMLHQLRLRRPGAGGLPPLLAGGLWPKRGYRLCLGERRRALYDGLPRYGADRLWPVQPEEVAQQPLDVVPVRGGAFLCRGGVIQELGPELHLRIPVQPELRHDLGICAVARAVAIHAVGDGARLVAVAARVRVGGEPREEVIPQRVRGPQHEARMVERRLQDRPRLIQQLHPPLFGEQGPCQLQDVRVRPAEQNTPVLGEEGPGPLVDVSHAELGQQALHEGRGLAVLDPRDDQLGDHLPVQQEVLGGTIPPIRLDLRPEHLGLRLRPAAARR
mmetsp:Transcript_97149/g.302466  ORF Transcript_97149/g.302466 Transcript_97149/m.302466 type:complete len:301 (-) Transcript_97149:908-1810(-)